MRMKDLILTNSTIRAISIVSAVVAIAFPLLNIYYIYPSFTALLVENTEKEAVRVGRYLSDIYFKDKELISSEDLIRMNDTTLRQIKHFHLMNLKIFSPSGETVYSRNKGDIGKVNENDYFKNIVSKGIPYTKMVKKNTPSLEGQIISSDVVETYVPVMSDGKFIGAFEIYYNITDRVNAITGLIYKSSIIPITAMFLFLVGIIAILFKLDKNLIRQKEVEKELKVYSDKLRRSNQELQDFAHIASHDLQEPLRKVSAFSERLRTRYADILDEQGLDYLNRMDNASGRMRNLIEGLLDYSRVTTKAQPFRQVDLGKVVRDVLSDLEMRIQDTGGRVEVAELPVIDADPLQMQQIFQNLIGNALKFHKKDQAPVVRVSAEPAENSGVKSGAGRFSRIIVADNGIGFDNKYEERIFGVFQRLHGRQEYEGSGIGLSVCKKIAERHGGNIAAQSTPGEGARFIITLPVKQGEGEHHGR